MSNNRVLALIAGVSLVAALFLFYIIYGPTPPLAWLYPAVSYLPAVNALLNLAATVCLVFGLIAIRAKNIALHKRSMLGAFIMSSLFLITYCLYHAAHGDTLFMGTGLIRPVYFFILISHVVLSIVALPLILATFYFSLTNQISIHKRWARVTWPIWFYVSVTGVLVYLLLKFFG